MISIKKRILDGYYLFFKFIPFLKPIYYTRRNQTPVKFSMWFLQKVVGFNRKTYWPVHFSSKIGNFKNIIAGIDTSPGYMPGCYIQGGNPIFIGDYTQIGPNVGIISRNHGIYDNRTGLLERSLRIGKYCWIGMNSVILPGVHLGDFTIVGSGSVVTKSFVDGYCIIAGNPARVIRKLDRGECVQNTNRYEYYGYIAKGKFEKYRKKYLKI